MKNTPGHPDQESPRASSESLLFNKDSEGKLLPGSESTMFDCEGPEMTACGIGHICYDCWDDLPEGRVMG
jgi:hypothetical protein